MARTICSACGGRCSVLKPHCGIADLNAYRLCEQCNGTGEVDSVVGKKELKRRLDRVKKKYRLSDTEILDWLDNHSGRGWVCVNPSNNTGLRLNEMTKDVAGTDDRVYPTIREAVIAEMGDTPKADERIKRQEFIPQIIMQLEIANRQRQVFRIVQTYRSDGCTDSMGLRLEYLRIDSMGKESWIPGEDIPDWVEVLIDQYLYPT